MQQRPSSTALQAAEDAPSLEAGTDDYKQAVIDAIASGTIDGITGTFTFDETHDPVRLLS